MIMADEERDDDHRQALQRRRMHLLAAPAQCEGARALQQCDAPSAVAGRHGPPCLKMTAVVDLEKAKFGGASDVGTRLEESRRTTPKAEVVSKQAGERPEQQQQQQQHSTTVAAAFAALHCAFLHLVDTLYIIGRGDYAGRLEE
ncbi:uncharacterized protein MYCFIDRAFT_173408 [Pseudocercospora fijiensis CIRAD86]|uniref:Uncharacterized protein n=1 Tax=Pseudocercospora fijiensis (strain CIRAD86) TaxID=383855 RepID=M3B4W1_PSEFD|nr:uncharacterized protein MYCFIDRAFT_173408 [Pseudocercospora fijiensis CIRAD86]EME84408.1 hypothetical protein MYCFIDRAFT_173408 [Pseudocercospora fijiensis CIRAD86]